MKKLYAILTEKDEQSTAICDAMTNLPKATEFCGCWGAIQGNRSECIAAISATINHFIDSPEKNTIIFACDRKEVDDIEKALHLDGCDVQRVPVSKIDICFPV